MTGLLIVAALAAFVILWAVGQRPSAARVNQDRGRANRQTTHRPSGAAISGSHAPSRLAQFTALSILPGRTSCEAARQQSRQRYLKIAAPELPLRGCDASRCQCAFAEHPDRRTAPDSDRRMGIGLQSELYGSQGEPERRHRRGRRVSDRYRSTVEAAGSAR